MGIMTLTDKYKSGMIKILVIIFYTLNFSWFIYQYVVVLPNRHADWWLWGYQELIGYLKTQETGYDRIIISGKAGMPYIYYLFYNAIDPAYAQAQIVHNYQADEFGFEHVNAIGKYRFIRNFTWEKDGVKLPSATLLVVTGKEAVGDNVRQKNSIRYPNQTPAFKIYEIL